MRWWIVLLIVAGAALALASAVALPDVRRYMRIRHM